MKINAILDVGGGGGGAIGSCTCSLRLVTSLRKLHQQTPQIQSVACSSMTQPHPLRYVFQSDMSTPNHQNAALHRVASVKAPRPPNFSRPTYIILSQCQEVFLNVLDIVIETSDDHSGTGLVSREPYVHPVLLHHLGDGLATCSDQPAVHAVVNIDLITDLFLLKSKQVGIML